MTELPGWRQLYVIQREMTADMKQMFRGLAGEIRGILLSYGDTIARDDSVKVRVEVGRAVQNTFVGDIPGQDGKHAFGSDGVTPLAAYPRILNKYLGQAIRAAVEPHARYMRDHLPMDLQIELSMARQTIQEMEPPWMILLQRLWRSNPLASYDPPHRWVDPAGYRLSDRIWRTSEITRMNIDKIVAQAIQNGMSSVDISNLIQRYLQPAEAGKTTMKPYGYKVSFSGMRLARTEITRAHSMASKLAALGNPFVSSMSWKLSPSHPKYDICDGLAAASPYPVIDTPVPAQDSHPHCLCCLVSNVDKLPSQVVAELREALDAARAQNLEPIMTPLQSEAFIEALMGRMFYTLIGSVGV